MFSTTRQRLSSALVALSFVTLLAAAPAQAASIVHSQAAAPDQPGTTGTGGGAPSTGTGGEQGGMIDPNG